MGQITINEPKVPATIPQAPAPKKQFKGYTMEELRYQKALAALRKEFCKSNITQSIQNLRHPVDSSRLNKAIPFVGKVARAVPAPARSTGVGIAKVAAKALVSRLKPWDYIMLGISLIGPTRNAIKKLRGKKKKG